MRRRSCCRPAAIQAGQPGEAQPASRRIGRGLDRRRLNSLLPGSLVAVCDVGGSAAGQGRLDVRLDGLTALDCGLRGRRRRIFHRQPQPAGPRDGEPPIGDRRPYAIGERAPDQALQRRQQLEIDQPCHFDLARAARRRQQHAEPLARAGIAQLHHLALGLGHECTALRHALESRRCRRSRRPATGRRHPDDPAGRGRTRLDSHRPGQAKAEHARTAGPGGRHRLQPCRHVGPAQRAPARHVGVRAGEHHPELVAPLEHRGRDRPAPAEAQLQHARTAFGRNVDAWVWQSRAGRRGAFPKLGVSSRGQRGRPGRGRRHLHDGARTRDRYRPRRPSGGLDRHRCAHRGRYRGRGRRDQCDRHRDTVQLDHGEPGMRLAQPRIHARPQAQGELGATVDGRRMEEPGRQGGGHGGRWRWPSTVLPAAVRLRRRARGSRASAPARPGRACPAAAPTSALQAAAGASVARACCGMASQRPKRSAMAARTSDRPPVDEGNLAGQHWRMVNVGPRAMIRRAPAVTTW